MKNHRSLAGIDLARFTYELDESVEDVLELVSDRFGMALGKN